MTDVVTLVMDGGMGKELQRNGAPFRQPEWSALALMEAPELVARTHTSFIDAGARLIIANTYAVVPFHIGAERFRGRGRELAALAAQLARRAADASSEHVLVAASIPPVFGSYQPELFDAEAAPAMLDMLIEAQAPYVDLWLAETIGSVAEAVAIGEALDRFETTRARWFSFSLHDDLVDGRPVLWSGESVAAGVEAAVGFGAEAVLLNCAAPEAIDMALPELAATLEAAGSPARFGAYANGFVPRDEVKEYAANEALLERRDDLTPEVYASMVGSWLDLGASIVGGCCSIHPEHIAAVAAMVQSRPAPPAGQLQK
ncbi:MAG: homocysteine S-methyltransferase family protein [Acidimicrobiales bacterium]